ncbi:MAG: IS1182 family transposase [Candidatus Eisenbacteria bacterium]|nr:IS1182 family transposase [Candidatus Eisenbacteria bacterium]
MPRFKPYSYEQMLMIPVDLKNQLQAGTFEFALNGIVDEMDLSIFDGRFRNDETGAPAYDPAILLKIVLFAYSRGITSSREIERACRENVVFMALSADSHPHFTKIAEFISSMEEEIVPLFRNVLMICAEEGLIGRQMFAIDGRKIASNCAKEWSGTRKDFEKKRGKLEKSIHLLLRKHRETDESDEGTPGMREKEEEAVERLRAKVKKIEGWLENGEDKKGSSGNVKQSNLTDNESAKMPSAHGVVQGYNGIAAVDGKHQVVVHAEAFGEGQEKQLLKPMLDGMRENFAEMGEQRDVLETAVLVADNGYHSEENVRMVLEGGIDAYLPDNRFRKRDPLFKTAERHRRPVDRKKTSRQARYFQVADFRYDETKGKLVCPAGKELYLKNRNFGKTKGYRAISYMGKKTDCRVCELRAKCLRKAHTVARQVTIFHGREDGEKSYTQRMIERFDTLRGRFLYSRRLGIVEPVFANICHARGLNRFTLRGKVKVDIQWKLFSMVHNIVKIVRYGPRFA